MAADNDSRILEYLEEGLFLYGVGKVQESISRWRKVLELDPKNERALDYIESAGGDVSAYRAKSGKASRNPPPASSPPSGDTARTWSAAAAANAGIPEETQRSIRPIEPDTTPGTILPFDPFAPAAPEGREELLAKAAALYRARYHEAALELLEKVAREFPPVDEALQGYLDATRNALLEQMRGQWSRQDQVPKPRLEPSQVMQLK